MKGKKWEREELEIVKRNYENGDLIKLSKKLGRPIKAFRHVAQKFNIKRNIHGKNNPHWKGDKVGYISLHEWIKNHKPKPKFCEKCKKVPPFDLANISGKYTRDVNDFKWICRKCHMKKDGRLNKLGEFNKSQRRKHLQCIKCKQFKLKEQFYKDKYSWNRLGYYCKKCSKKCSKKYYYKNRKKNDDRGKGKRVFSITTTEIQ